MKVLKRRGKYIILKVIHENICIGWCAYHTDDTAFYLKIVLAAEHKLV